MNKVTSSSKFFLQHSKVQTLDLVFCSNNDYSYSLSDSSLLAKTFSVLFIIICIICILLYISSLAPYLQNVVQDTRADLQLHVLHKQAFPSTERYMLPP